MSGIRLTNLIAIPFVAGVLYVSYQLFFLRNDQWWVALIPLLVILIALYLASNDINYWYYTKFPPPLEAPVKAWLNRFFPFYKTLRAEEKSGFEKRLSLYLEGRAFKLVLKEHKNIPEDFKAIIAAHAIEMTMGLDDFLLEPYERIFCYNHPFPTPDNQFLHTVEVNHEDGVILLSIEQLMQGVGQRESYFNIAYYAYALILLEKCPGLGNLEDDRHWNMLEQVSGLARDTIVKITGFTSPDINAAGLALFFTFPHKFKAFWEDQYLHISKYLGDVHGLL